MTQNNVQLQNGNGPLAGLRNQIINGDFSIWQRGSSGFTGQKYTADRWYSGSSSGLTINRFNVDGASGKAWGMQLVSTATTAFVQQAIELTTTGKPNPFTPGSVWTFSIGAAVSSGTTDMAVRYGFANSVNFSGSTSVITETAQTVDVTGGRYTFQVTIPAGIAATNTCFILGLTFTANSDIRLYNAQLEPGPVATPFEERPIATEAALCQRYYQRVGIQGTVICRGGGLTSDDQMFTLATTTLMRVSSPSFSFEKNGAVASAVLANTVQSLGSDIQVFAVRQANTKAPVMLFRSENTSANNYKVVTTTDVLLDAEL